MLITDNKRTVEILCLLWEGDDVCRYTEWSNEFFVDEHMTFRMEDHALIVEDVDYCIDQANDDWAAAWQAAGREAYVRVIEL